MKLKKLLEGFVWERKPGQPLPSLKEANGEGFDYEEVYGLVSDAAEQAANQARRYVAGAEKQLEGLLNMLERNKRQKSFDA